MVKTICTYQLKGYCTKCPCWSFGSGFFLIFFLLFFCLLSIAYCTTYTEFGVLDFQVEVEVYACAGFLLLCLTTFIPRIEILRVHTLTLPHENLKLKIVKPLMISK